MLVRGVKERGVPRGSEAFIMLRVMSRFPQMSITAEMAGRAAEQEEDLYLRHDI